MCATPACHRQYINPYYQSAQDNGTQITLEPIVATAVMLARTLHSLAAPAGAQPLKVRPGATRRVRHNPWG